MSSSEDEEPEESYNYGEINKSFFIVNFSESRVRV